MASWVSDSLTANVNPIKFAYSWIVTVRLVEAKTLHSTSLAETNPRNKASLKKYKI